MQDEALSAYARQDLNGAQCAFERLLSCDPHSRIAQSYLLQLAFYDERVNGAHRLASHRDWARQFTPGTARFVRHGRPRIGYVSQSFIRRPYGTILQPILRHHNRSHFDIYCYSSMDSAFEGEASWHDISNARLSDILDRIRADEIDILVNMDGHADAQTIIVFAHQAAPIQISLAVYPGSTGLSNIGYRFTDAFADPPEQAQSLYTERLRFLPAFLPFAPELPVRIEKPPFQRHGFLTFGVYGNPLKIGPASLTAWAQILVRSPESRIVFHHTLLCGQRPPGRSVIDPGIQERLSTPFLRAGVSPKRIAFVGGLEWRDHMDFHNEIDIMLDTHPYNGCTTTFGALWMGVPSLALEGDCFVERTTHALLKHVALDRFCSHDWMTLVDKAVKIAESPDELFDIRHRLRQLILNSPVTDVENWVRSLEFFYWALIERSSL